MKHYLSESSEYRLVLEEPSSTFKDLLICKIKRSGSGVYIVQIWEADEKEDIKNLPRHTGSILRGDTNSITESLSIDESSLLGDYSWAKKDTRFMYYYLALPLEIDDQTGVGTFLYTCRASTYKKLLTNTPTPVTFVQTIEAWIANFPDEETDDRKKQLEQQFNCKLNLKRTTVQHDLSYVDTDIIRKLLEEQSSQLVFGNKDSVINQILQGSKQQAYLYKAGQSLIKTETRVNKELPDCNEQSRNKWPFIFDLKDTVLECSILPITATSIVIKNLVSCIETTAEHLGISKYRAWKQINSKHLSESAKKFIVMSAEEFLQLGSISHREVLHTLLNVIDTWVIDYDDLITNLNDIMLNLGGAETSQVRAVIRSLSDTSEKLTATYFVLDIGTDTFDSGECDLNITIEPKIIRYGAQDINLYIEYFIDGDGVGIDIDSWDKDLQEIKEVIAQGVEDLSKFKLTWEA